MQNLQPFHTFSLPAKAKKIIEIHSIPALQQAWQDCLAEQLPVLFLGQGSNVLFVEDFEGAVLLNRLLGIEHREDADFHYLHVTGGEVWHDLVKWLRTGILWFGKSGAHSRLCGVCADSKYRRLWRGI